jgi:hypothetical protein
MFSRWQTVESKLGVKTGNRCLHQPSYARSIAKRPQFGLDSNARVAPGT